MMKTMQAICVVVLLIAVALAACASPTQETTPTPTMPPATSTPTPPPTPTPRLMLPPNSAIYLLAEGEERGHLISAQELEGLPDEVITPLRQRLEEGEEYRAQLAMQGAEPAVALGVTSRGETTPFALVVTAEGDHPEGTLIMPGANGEPLFLEPLIQGEQGDQIAPVLVPGADQPTWGLFTETGHLVALVDQYNRWSTESTLCREFWEQQLPQMDISVEGKTSDQISRMGGDVFFALKLWLADQETPPASWEQIPAGWQWHGLAEQEAYEGGDQDGLLAVVVSPDGQVYVAEWDHEWGQDYGYFQEDGKTPVGARRVKLLAPLPDECFDEQGQLRQGLEFKLSPEGALQVGVGDKIYTYDEQQRIWVVSERPKPEGMLDLNGFEERWNSDLNRWEYIDAHGQVIAYWDEVASRIELAEAVKNGEIALDFTEHAALFVPGDSEEIKAQIEASLPTNLLRFPIPFDVSPGGRMWYAKNPRGKAMWLCFDGLPAGTKFRTFLADEKIMFGGDETGHVFMIDNDSGWEFSAVFGFGQDLSGQRISGAVNIGEVLFVLRDPTRLISDERKVFVDGSLPQVNFGAVRWLPEEKRLVRPNPWEMLLRDPQGRLVYWP